MNGFNISFNNVHTCGCDASPSTTAKTPWLDGKHVLFGRVLEGMETLKKIEKTPTNNRDKPNVEIKLVDSGLLPQQ